MTYNKKFTGIALAAVLLAAPAQGAEEVTVRYSNWLPQGLVFNKDVMTPWIADVERVTEGRVNIETTPKVVGSVAGQYDVVTDGLADLVFYLPGYTPGRFPLLDGLELPLLSDDPHVRCTGMWKAYEQFIAPTDAFSDSKVLGVFCASAGQIALTNKEIKSADDLKGLKIRAANPSTAHALELLGASPVSKPASEIYELVSGGVIDGAVIPLDSLVDFKLEGPLKKVGELPGGMMSTVIIVAMSKDAWAKISPEDQKAIEGVSGLALADRAATALVAATEAARTKLKDAGVQVYTLDDAVVQDLTKTLAPVRANWVELAKTNGLADPEAMLALFEKK